MQLETIIYIFIGIALLILYVVLRSKMERDERAASVQKMRYTRLGQIINESIDLFNNSKNIETRKSRIAVAIDSLEKILIEFPNHIDVETNKKIYDVCIKSQREVHFYHIDSNVEKFMLKSKVAKSHSSKITNAVKALEYIELGFSDEFVDKDKLQTLKDSVKNTYQK